MRNVPQLSVFIVEDNQMFTLYIDTILKEQFNFRISTFPNGKECIKSLNLTPDIVILDYMLDEDMDGLQVLNTIRKQLPDTPVILMTGQKDIETAIRLMKAGAYEYIIKDQHAPGKLVNAILKIKQEKGKKWKRFILA